MKLSALLIVLASVSLTALAQLALKLASSRFAAPPADQGFIASLIAQFMHPLTLSAMVLYGGSLVLWLIALRDVPLSVAYPFAGLTIALVAVLGIVVLGEGLAWPQAFGIGMIAVGVIVLAKF
ncbi:MAG: multidrug efflux SMR transporter [Burkholderiaceae bacterium]